MIKRIALFVAALSLALALPAQTKSRKVQNMQQQKTNVENKLKKNEKALKDNKKAQQDKSRQIASIERQIKQRVQHIHHLEARIDSTARSIKTLERRMEKLNGELTRKKKRYAHAMRYARTQRLNMSPIVFILAGDTPVGMMRRIRYAKQYAVHQRHLGESVLKKRGEALDMQHSLLRKRDEMNRLLQEIITQRKKLANDRQRQQDVLNGLVKTQKNLDAEMARQRKQIAELDRQIEERIAYEIEQERKRQEAMHNRRDNEARRKDASKGASGGVWNTSADRALSGSFEQNKGRLPVPVTGSYMITGRFGKYTPEGTKGVTLDNKGMNYTGQEGTRARAVFDGVVTAIVESGGMKHVLVRHGSYISAYCNLSSVIVTRGQKVRARDLLGSVAKDSNGQFTLQFQLRKERTLLNPALWIGR